MKYRNPQIQFHECYEFFPANPVELAAKVAVHTVNRCLQDNPDSFDLVEWVLFDTHTEAVYEAEVDKLYKMG